MNHDITHCKGGDCPKKDKCYRHQALNELQALGKDVLVSMLKSPDVCKDNDYKYFMKGDNQ